MNDTQLLISNGNHDASLAAIRAGYPAEWFPDSGGGYYESDVNGVHLFTVNTETYNNDSAQRNWLKSRLTEITAESGNLTKPILVQGHRPASNTAMDGQQAVEPSIDRRPECLPSGNLLLRALTSEQQRRPVDPSA